MNRELSYQLGCSDVQTVQTDGTTHGVSEAFPSLHEFEIQLDLSSTDLHTSDNGA